MKGITYEQRFGPEKAAELKNNLAEKAKARGSRSEETKDKLRAANLGKKNGPSKLRGRTTSEEVKKKISGALKGRPGVKHSEETKRKISETKRKNNRSLIAV